MAKGLAIPLKPNRRGGAKTLQGSPYLDQVVRSGLQPNTSRNPFQQGDGVDVGISELVVFRVNDNNAEAFFSNQVNKFFRRLREAELAQLLPGQEGLSFTRESDTGELTATIRYLDLEADRESEVEINVMNALRGSPYVALR